MSFAVIAGRAVRREEWLRGTVPTARMIPARTSDSNAQGASARSTKYGTLQREETVTWTGGCSGGLATGAGTLEWRGRDADGEASSETSTGQLQNGRFHGHWTLRASDGTVVEGSYADGKRHGRWVERLPAGDVWEGGPYVDRKMHGRWVQRPPDGDVWEGPFVDGKLHGLWVERRADGTVREWRFEDGRVVEMPPLD